MDKNKDTNKKNIAKNTLIPIIIFIIFFIVRFVFIGKFHSPIVQFILLILFGAFCGYTAVFFIKFFKGRKKK